MHQGLWKNAVCHESISGHSVWCAGRKCTVSGVSFLGIKARRVCTYALYAALQSGGERSETLLRCAE